MLKKILGFVFLSCAFSGVSQANTERPSLLRLHAIKHSQQIKQNTSTIDPGFIGNWSGTCIDDGYQYTLKVVIDETHLIREELTNDYGSNKTEYYLNSIDSEGMSDQTMYMHSTSKLRLAANKALAVDETVTSANQNQFGDNADNALQAYISTTTYAVKNNQLDVTTVGKRLVGGQSADNAYNFSCTINKENISQ